MYMRYMRATTLITMISMGLLLGISATSAYSVHADTGQPGRFRWPLRPHPPVTRAFDAPTPPWLPGHRGVDLAGTMNQPVYAAGAGSVVFARLLAGRPLVSVAHPGGLRTTYEPVEADVTVGQLVDSSTVLGYLAAGHPGCPVAACLHWGALWGPASQAHYVNPLGLLADTPIRLKPVRR